MLNVRLGRYLRLFGRGMLQVALVSANTVQVAHQHYVGMTIVGFLISVVWWHNAKSSNRNDDLPLAGPVYAAGAAFGTLSGAAVMGWWYR